MNSPEPPKLKLCWHFNCNLHRVLCFLGIHKLPRNPFAMAVKKREDQMFLEEHFACVCTKRVEIRTRAMVNMRKMTQMIGLNYEYDDNDEDHLFTVH